MDRTFPPFILYCFDLRPPTESEACFWYAFSVWSAMTGAAVTPQPKSRTKQSLSDDGALAGLRLPKSIDFSRTAGARGAAR